MTEDSRTTKLVEGGSISATSADETQKAVDCLTRDFELKVKSSSDESASDVKVIHHNDDDTEMDEHLMDQTIDEEDEEDDEDDGMDEYENACQVCLKEEHRTAVCPFRKRIPDPRNTKLGPDYIILCKCCHKQDVHSDDDDEWEGEAVYDPCLRMYLTNGPDDDPCAMITDLREVETLRSLLNKEKLKHSDH